mmetsp:Transcript_56117/g.92838  ORF Transcript_56117/g.92838 Transcript_56117/m.92838 type:complete len:210 (-) Transcript_56117:253-882(-)
MMPKPITANLFTFASVMNVVAVTYAWQLIPAQLIATALTQLVARSSQPSNCSCRNICHLATSLETSKTSVIGSSEIELLSIIIPVFDTSIGLTAIILRCNKRSKTAKSIFKSMQPMPNMENAMSCATYSSTPHNEATSDSTVHLSSSIFSWVTVPSMAMLTRGATFLTTTIAPIEAKLKAIMDEASMPANNHGTVHPHRYTSRTEPKWR